MKLVLSLRQAEGMFSPNSFWMYLCKLNAFESNAGPFRVRVGVFSVVCFRARHVRFPRWALRPPNSTVFLVLLDPDGLFPALGPPSDPFRVRLALSGVSFGAQKFQRIEKKRLLEFSWARKIPEAAFL